MTPERAMAGWPGLSLSEAQCRFLIHGRELEAEALAGGGGMAAVEGLQIGEWVRLDGPGGQLVGLARWPGPGQSLHAELVWASIGAFEETATRS